LTEYFTEKGWRKFLDKLNDVLWEAEKEGVIPDSLPIIEDIEDRITPQVKAKVLTKSEVMDEIKKILEERGGPLLISWLRSKYGELPIIEEMIPPSLEEMYAEAEQKIRELEEEVKRLRAKKIAPTKVRGLEEQVKELKKQVEEKEIKLREAEQEIARLKKELEKYEPYLPGEIVYVHIERGWPTGNEFFEYQGSYGRYVGSVCDIIEVDKRDFESEQFRKFIENGIVSRAVMSPEQAEAVKDEIAIILKDRGFRGKEFDALFREVVRLVDWSARYDEALKEARARAKSITPTVPPAVERPTYVRPRYPPLVTRLEEVRPPETHPLFPEYLKNVGFTLDDFFASSEAIQRELKRGFIFWLKEKEKGK
jgi:hypothetical protein